MMMATPRAASTSQNLPTFCTAPGSSPIFGIIPHTRRRRGGRMGYDGVVSGDFIIRPGRREDAEEAARLWMQSAEEHTAHDRIYATVPGAEQVMRRFLSDLASSGHSFLFVAESGGRVVGFISGELREGSPTFRQKTWASVDDVFVEQHHRNLGIGRG